MEQVVCDFCGEQSATTKYILRDFYLGMSGEFNLVRCNRCGLLYLNPRPEWSELQFFYQNRYEPPTARKRIAALSWVPRYGLLRRCRAVLRYQRGGRLLDVGCGDGSFLREMSCQGQWELYGVDPFVKSCPEMLDDKRIKTLYNDLMQGNFPDSFFDVVTWWDVLEHVPNPSASLYETYRILKPGGWLFIQTPDPDAWDARLFGPYWMGFDAPRHLYLFPRHLLVNRLGELGFEIKRTMKFAGGTAVLFRSLSYWFGDRKRENLQRLMGIMEDSPLVRVTTAPLSFLMRRLGLVFSVLYIAQKPLQEPGRES